MLLRGSCHCGDVKFSVESDTPYPYMWCYCSICRKTAGGGGFAVNIMGLADTLEVTGAENISVYRSRTNDREEYEEDGLSDCRRHFCQHCGSALWVFSPSWPQSIYPFASAIDTPLPFPSDRAEIMLEHRCSWAFVPASPADAHFNRYPAQSIEEWHKAHDLFAKL